jgi:hypothetical protein
MAYSNTQRASIAAIVAITWIITQAANATSAELDCTLRFSLTGWSAILEHAEGRGVVTCADGGTMRVSIETKGGGLTVGKSHIDNGTGKFSDVHRITDVLGSYAEGGAHAGVVKSSTAQVLTKGNVSLALAGTGEGVDLGVSVGRFTLKRIK